MKTVRLSKLALVVIGSLCAIASYTQCLDLEPQCNGCPCITNCRSGCGVVLYEYKKNRWCQRCGCMPSHEIKELERERGRERELERERESGFCDGCPCMGVCEPKCGIIQYEYKKKKWCQKVNSLLHLLSDIYKVFFFFYM
jgi:hypothetical protein